MSRRLATALVSVLFVCGVVFASLSLLKPRKPPELPPAAVVHPALTRHLLFLIVDGLRYDIATNPERMPRFAAAMKQHRSADIMAGTVSMTSSAIQTFGSGQRGRLEQIARNINPDPPPFQSWMQNAQARGLTVALVGDRTWSEMYGAHFNEKHLDPPGVAIGVPQLLLARQPAVGGHDDGEPHLGVRAERHVRGRLGEQSDHRGLLPRVTSTTHRLGPACAPGSGRSCRAEACSASAVGGAALASTTSHSRPR